MTTRTYRSKTELTIQGDGSVVSMREKEKKFKRQLIADAAYGLLSEKPYESVTVDDIARAAGCGKGTLYQYFENKDHILAYLVSRDLEKLCMKLKEKCVSNPDIQEAIFQYLLLQYYFYLDNQIFSSWLRVSLGETVRPEWAQEVLEQRENKIKMVAQLLDRGVQEKALIEVDALQLARLMENIFRDITYSLLDKKPDEEEVERLLELVKKVIGNGIFLNRAFDGRQ